MKKNNLPRHQSSKQSFNYLISFLLIAAGSLLLGKNLGFIDTQIYHILMSWQMLLIILGVYTFFKKNYASGLIITTVGIYFILPRIEWINTEISRIFWPILLILLGIYLIFYLNKPKIKQPNSSHSFTHQISEDGYIYSDNSFSSIKHSIRNEELKGGTIRARFGGVIVDLRTSYLTQKVTYLDIDCSFAGVELYLPSDWSVKIELNSFLGGCEDSRIPLATTDTEHVLIVRGNLTFSGVEIKS